MKTMNYREFLKSTRAKTILIVAVLIAAGFLLPQQMTMPVQGATVKDWNQKSWWYEPWGVSGVHKGIDIFAPTSTPVVSPTYGLVIYRGQLALGGNVLVILGPKWRIHYFAHLNKSYAGIGTVVSTGEKIAEVGDSGNAKGKPPHLHYQINTLFPYPWRWDSTSQGWKKMFILNPNDYLLKSRQI